MISFSNNLFQISKESDFAEPRNQHYSLQESYTLGSAGINDTSMDLNTHIWKGYIKDNWFTLKRIDLSIEHKIIETGSVEQLDFTFDQAMRPVLVWVKDGISWMYRYENTNFHKIQLPQKIQCPRVELDRKLLKDMPQSDIILGYCYDGKLCFAQQRERYQEEYIIGENPNKHLLWRIGHTTDGRFGFLWR